MRFDGLDLSDCLVLLNAAWMRKRFQSGPLSDGVPDNPDPPECRKSNHHLSSLCRCLAGQVHQRHHRVPAQGNQPADHHQQRDPRLLHLLHHGESLRRVCHSPLWIWCGARGNWWGVWRRRSTFVDQTVPRRIVSLERYEVCLTQSSHCLRKPTIFKELFVV